MGLEPCIQDFVKTHFAIFVNQTVLENSRGLIDERFNQVLSTTDFISQKIEDSISDVSWCEQIVPMVINREFLPYLAVEINQELSYLLGGVSHLALSKRGILKNCLEEFRINWGELLICRILHIENSHIGRETGGDLVSTDC